MAAETGQLSRETRHDYGGAPEPSEPPRQSLGFVEKERSRPSRSLLVRSGRFALG